jgi:hypothetical protein
MVRKTLVALAALLSLCSLAGSGAATATAAQIALTPTNVIGGTDAYNGNPGGGYWNSGSFPASNILSTQTGIVSEASYTGFWLNADSNASSPYITISLGGSFDNLSQVELFNTHNGGYNDRGTGQFQIVGGNAVTNEGTTLAPNYELTGPTTVLFSGTLAAANSGQDATGIPAQTFNAIATGSFQYLAFEPLTVAADGNGGLGCCGPDNFGLNEIRVFTSPEPNSYVGLVGLGGIGLLGIAFRRRIVRSGRVVAVLALALLLGFTASHASAGTITTITSGDAGGGVTLNPARIVYADDIFGQQGNANVVQSVTFTAGNSNIVDVQTYGAQANGGGDPPSGTFMNNDANSSALLNIVTSLIYGAQTVTIGGLTPNDPYTVQRRSQISNAIEARRMSLENRYRRKHRWDVPMGEVLQTSPLGTESQRWHVILRPKSGIA